MLAGGGLGRWLAITALASGVAACASGRQVYQTTQDNGSGTVAGSSTSDDALVSMSGREAGSDQILQLSGNVVLPVYRLDGPAGLDLKVALAGAEVQASLAAPALLDGPPGVIEPGTVPAAVGALQGQAAAAAARVAPDAAIATPGVASPGLASPGLTPPSLAAPTTLAAVDLGGGLGSAAPPTGLAVGAPVSGAVAGAISPINAAVASLPRPAGR